MGVVIAEARWEGHAATSLGNGAVSLVVTRDMGPRIIDLRLPGGRNLLAELPAFTVPCPGVGPFHFWGGHRLWEAPEVAARTYLPDDRPVEVTPLERGLAASAPPPVGHHLRKRLRITLPDETATIVVEHSLTNESLWPIRCAPWAITMFPPGGLAVLPQPTDPVDPDGLLPNRRLSFWPYADLAGAHIAWGNAFVHIRAALTQGAFKVGWENPAGWLAYWRGGTAFLKWAPFSAGADYPDGGSNSECYANPQFLELETLGPLQTIQPGGTIRHLEAWRVIAEVPAPTSDAAGAALVRQSGLPLTVE